MARRRLRRFGWALFAVVGGMLVVVHAQGDRPGKDADWPMYNRDLAGTRYSPLKRGFKAMRERPCDVPLGSHPAMHNMTAKHAKLGGGGPNAFIDSQGYKAEIDLVEGVFTSVLAEQRKAGAQQ